MNLLVKISVVVICLVGLAACGPNCKCDVPGPALVKVFVADDGIPNVNIETVVVYPEQKVVFEGPKKFSLIFKGVSPDDASERDREYSTDDGVIEITVGKEFKDALSSMKYDKRTAQTQGESPELARHITIKYDVEVNGKVRDPKMKIIPK